MNSDSETVLELVKVSKKFGSNRALDDVSYSVKRGSVFALLGENGAGKTTTIRILLGLCSPDTGTSRVLGLDSERDDLKIRQSVGFVPEQPVLYDWMTVEEIGRFASAFYPVGYFERYRGLIADYELPSDSRIKSLSKGMRAKVSLSLAIANDPDLLILDEPTSGLDPLVRREFLESMVDRAATGRTVFLSSHQIGEVERVADMVAIMKKSKLLVVESLEELKSSSYILNLTFKENATPFLPLEPFIEKKVEGREMRILARHRSPSLETSLADSSDIARFEFRTPSLEEIFIAYMSKG